LNPRLRNLMVRKWSTVPISLSYTTPRPRSQFPLVVRDHTHESESTRIFFPD
jgi:hypothetical protein